MRKIVLASGSPRRREILSKLPVVFEVVSGDYVEDMTLPLPPDELVKALSLGKARSVEGMFDDAIIIAADSIVVFNGEVFGKPRTASEAEEMLRTLQGQRNTIMTGMTIIDTKTGTTESFVSSTDVFLTRLSDREIKKYVATKEPLDKAGAYAIQGIGAMFIKRLEGDFYGAVGLSLTQVAERLEKFGVSVLQSDT